MHVGAAGTFDRTDRLALEHPVAGLDAWPGGVTEVLLQRHDQLRGKGRPSQWLRTRYAFVVAQPQTTAEAMDG